MIKKLNFKKSLVSTLFVMFVITAVINFTNIGVPFYAKEFNNLEDSLEHANKIDTTYGDVFDVTDQIHGVYVPSTAYSVSTSELFYSGQGLYLVDNSTNKIVYCLDPTKAIGNDISYSDLESQNSHVFWNLDKNAQEEVIKYATAANQLYENTKEELYLVAGQMLVWDAAGFNLDHTVGVSDQLEEIKALVKEGIEINEDVILLNTKGQDLIQVQNSPVIEDPENIYTENAPKLIGNYYVYKTDAEENGTNILLEESELENSNFGIQAVDEEDGDISKNVNADYSKVNFKMTGAYPVEFSVTDSDKNISVSTQYLYITDDSWVMNEDSSMIMSAKNVIMNTKDPAEYERLAGIRSYELKTGIAVDVEQEITEVIDLNDGSKKANGEEDSNVIVELKNSAKTDSSKISRINYLVYSPEGQIISENPYLFAKDAKISVNETFSNDMLGATAYDIQDQKNLCSEIVYDLEAVDTTKVGVYPVKMSVKDSQGNFSEKTSYLTVQGDESEINENILLNGHSFVISLEEFLATKDIEQEISERGDVFALNTSTGENVDVTIDTKQLQGVSEQGIYQVTLSAKDDTASAIKTINVVVDEQIEEGNIITGANNVVINEGEKYSPEMHKYFAYNVTTNQDLTKDVTVIESVDSNVAGVYPVEFKYDDITFNAFAIVRDDNTIIEDGIYLDAEDFSSKYSEYEKTQDKEKFIKDNSSLKTYDLNTGENVDVKISTDLTSINNPGVYEIMFVVNDTISKEISMLLLADDEEIPSDGTPFIHASDATMSVNSEASNYDGVTLHNAYAYDKEDGFISDIVFDTENVIFQKVGTYPVKVSVSDSDKNTVVKDVNLNIVNDEVSIAAENAYVVEDKKYDIAMHSATAIDVDNSDISEFVYSDDKISTKEDGVFNTTLKADSKVSEKSSSIDKTVVVSDSDTVLNKEKETFVHGSDVVISLAELSQLNASGNLQNEIIKRGEMYAQSTKDASNINFTNDINDVLSEVEANGIYKVTISANEVTKVIDVVVTDQQMTENTYIEAENIVYDLNDEYSTDDFNAFAYNTVDGDVTDQIKFTGEVDTTDSGVYKVELSVLDQKIVKDVIVRSDASIPGEYIFIDGENFGVKYSEYEASLDKEQFVIDNSNIFAYDMVTGEELSVSVISDLDSITGPGVYQLDLEANNKKTSVVKEINVLLLEEQEELPTEGMPYIYATDATISVEDTQYDGIEFHNVYGYDREDGLLENIKIDTKDVVFGQLGVYPVVISVSDSDANIASKTVNLNISTDFMSITADNTYILENADYDINMHNAKATDVDNSDISQFVFSDDKISTEKEGVYKTTLKVNSQINYRNTSIDKTVVISDEDSALSSDKETFIHGKDVTLSLEELNELNSAKTLENEILLRGEMYAKSTKDALDVTLSNDIDEVLSQVDSNGIYEVTITANNFEKIINVVVTDGEMSENTYIEAENITYELGDTYNTSDFNAFAYNTIDGDVTDQIVFDGLVDTSKVGVYKVMLKVDDQEIVKTVTVKDDNSTINENIFIDAVNFDSKYSEYEATEDKKQFIIDNSNAVAYDIATGEELAVSVKTDLTSIIASGVYSVELEVKDTLASKEISMLLLAEDEEVPTNSEPFIKAVDGTISVNTAESDYNGIQTHTAYAYDAEDGILNNIVVDASDVTFGQAGVYNVKISVTDSDENTSFTDVTLIITTDAVSISADNAYVIENDEYNIDLHTPIAKDIDNTDITDFVYSNDVISTKADGVFTTTLKVDSQVSDKSSSIDKTVVVSDADSTLSEDEKTFIHGKDVVLSLTELNELNSLETLESEILSRGEMYAKNTTDASDVAVVNNIDEVLSEVKNNGIYEIIISASGLEHKIDVVVTDGETSENTYIEAENIIYDLGDAYNTDDFNAFAYNSVDGNVSEQIAFDGVVDTSKVGVYKVSLKVLDQEIIKTVTVKDDNSIISENIFIDGNNFDAKYSEYEASEDKEQFIIENTGAIAYDMSTGEVLTVNVITDLDPIQVANVYEIDLKASNGSTSASKEVSILLISEEEELPTDGTPYLHASDGVVSVDTTESDYVGIQTHAAYAYDAEDGILNDIVFDTKDVIFGQTGIYPVTISATDSDGKKASAEVKLSVTTDAVSISAENAYLSEAENYSIELHGGVATDIDNTDISEFIYSDDEISTETDGVYSTTLKVDSQVSDNSSSIDKTVVVSDKDSLLSEDKNTFLHGKDIVLSLAQLNEFNAAQTVESEVLSRGEMYANDTKDAAEITLTNDIVEVMSQVDTNGIYKITITANGLDKIINVVVTDGEISDNTYLEAENIVYDLNEVYSTNDFNAFAYNTVDGDITDEITFEGSVDTSSAGVYKVIVKVDDQEMVKTVTVKDENSIIDENIFLDASNFDTKYSEYEASEDKVKFIMDNSLAVAYDTESGEKLSVDIATDLVNLSKAGAYEVNLKVKDTDVSKDIGVLLLEDDQEMPTDGKPYIYAQDSTVDDKMTEESYDALLEHNFYAYDTEDGVLTPTINHSIMFQSAGVYPVSFDVSDSDENPNTNSITVNLNIHIESIIFMTLDKVIEVGEEEYDQNHHIAKAIDINGEELENITYSGNENIDTTKVGLTDVTITATSSVDPTITKTAHQVVAVLEIPYSELGEDPYLYAEDAIFNIDDEDVFADTSKFNAFSYDKQELVLNDNIIYNNGEEIVLGDTANVEPIDISVTDKDNNSAQLTRDMITTTDNSVIENDILIDASDIVINKDMLTEENVLIESGATAFDLKTGEKLETKVETDIVNNFYLGQSNVTISAESSSGKVEKKIKLVLLPNGETIEDGETYTYAKSLKVDLNSDYALKDHNAFGYDSELGYLEATCEHVDTSTVGIKEANCVAVKDDFSYPYVATVDVGRAFTADKLSVSNEDELNAMTSEEIEVFLLETFNVSSLSSEVINVKSPTLLSDEDIAYGAHEVTFVGESLSIDSVLTVLPKDEQMVEGESYLYVTDELFLDPSEDRTTYSYDLHEVFAVDETGAVAYDAPYTQGGEIVAKGEELLTTNGSVVEDQKVVSFEYNDTEYVPLVSFLPEGVNLNYKIDAHDLTFDYTVDISNLSNESFDYTLRLKSGLILGSGETVFTEELEKNSVSQGKILQSISGIESNLEYNLGLYQNETLVRGMEFTAPHVDPGTDGLYSNDEGTADDDNIGYIKDIYDLESIGYEDLDDPNKVEYQDLEEINNSDDLTIAKYNNLYRPYDANYALENSIDATATASNTLSDDQGGFGTDGFKPIGFGFIPGENYSSDFENTDGTEFLGAYTNSFDGRDRHINGLYISKEDNGLNSTSGSVGIFAKLDDKVGSTIETTPVVSDLYIDNALIQASDYTNVGVLTGTNNARINDVDVVNSSIVAPTPYTYVGGLVGMNELDGVVTDSSADVISKQSIYTEYHGVGGLVGANYGNSIVTTSFSSGEISGKNNVGGLVGNNRSEINKSYSTANVFADKTVGGLVGSQNHVDALIKDTYSTGDVTAATGTAGGLVGWNSKGEMRVNYTISNVKGGGNSVGGIVGLSTGYMDYNIALNKSITNTLGTEPGLVAGEGSNGINRSEYYTGINLYNSEGKLDHSMAADYSTASSLTKEQVMTKDEWDGFDGNNWDIFDLDDAVLPDLFNDVREQEDIILDW